MPRLISTLHATVLGLALPCLAIGHEGATHDTADASPRPDAHAPIGVMAEHTHSAGEFMLSYRFAVMNMAGNRDGTDALSADEIATQTPNRFADQPGQPPTLRVVPENMVMQMHMLGAMWAPSDRLTVMAMLPYLRKHMDHLTYAGGSGTTQLGRFTTVSEGLGDVSLGALASIVKTPVERLHTSFAIVAPTGDDEETAQVLAPNGMRPTLRLPYPMQNGSGAWAVRPGATYVRDAPTWSWGLQYQGTLYVSDADAGYQRGDVHQMTSWLAARLAPSLSMSVRLQLETEADIAGMDPAIRAPVQTADPARQGGERAETLFGANWQPRAAPAHRLALEAGYTVWQDLNGPQLERRQRLIMGYQYSW